MGVKLFPNCIPFPTSMKDGILKIYMAEDKIIDISIPWLTGTSFDWDCMNFDNPLIFGYLKNDDYSFVIRYNGTATVYTKDMIPLGTGKVDIPNPSDLIVSTPKGIYMRTKGADSGTRINLFSVKDSKALYLYPLPIYVYRTKRVDNFALNELARGRFIDRNKQRPLDEVMACTAISFTADNMNLYPTVMDASVNVPIIYPESIEFSVIEEYLGRNRTFTYDEYQEDIAKWKIGIKLNVARDINLSDSKILDNVDLLPIDYKGILLV